MDDKYINISKAFSSSLVEKVGASTTFNSFVPIKEIAQAKGLNSTRSNRMEINKPESKYISREAKVNGGTSSEYREWIKNYKITDEYKNIYGD